MRRAVVQSIGHYLPERVVENSEFESTLETNDAWIRSRTGIERRHFAAENETTSDMGIKAAQAALENAGCTVDDIDAVLIVLVVVLAVLVKVLVRSIASSFFVLNSLNSPKP